MLEASEVKLPALGGFVPPTHFPSGLENLTSCGPASSQLDCLLGPALSLAASGPASQLGWLAVALLLSLAACASFHCGASGPQSLPSSPPGYTCRLVPNIHEFNREGGVVRTQYIEKIEKGIKLYH